jgi:hypothetical protein
VLFERQDGAWPPQLRSSRGQALSEHVPLLIVVGLVTLFVVARFGGAVSRRFRCADQQTGKVTISPGDIPLVEPGCAGGDSVAPPNPPAEPKLPPVSFTGPMMGGVPLDHCVTFGKDCGKPAADAFCRSQGFSGSESFAEEMVATTRTPGGELCDQSFAPNRAPFCGRFTQIDCAS